MIFLNKFVIQIVVIFSMCIKTLIALSFAIFLLLFNVLFLCFSIYRILRLNSVIVKNCSVSGWTFYCLSNY